MKLHVLVTGGAGYIGSYVVPALIRRSHRVTVIDDLSNGHEDAIPKKVEFWPRDAGEHGFDADVVIHLASRIGVGDSGRDHWINNVGTTLKLFERTKAKKIIFASSAAVYGNGSASPIHEECDLLPVSTYGQTKATIERMMQDFKFESTALRLFNVAGGRERHKNETHLLPLALRGPVTLFGSHQMLRDYVHVEDVADAFVRAIDARPGVYNIGTAIGTSARSVFACIETVTGRPVITSDGAPRQGDPINLIANINRAVKHLDWAPKRDLLEIVRSAAQ